MGLARLCAAVATPEEMATLLEEMEKENLRFRLALLWALGEHEDFPPLPEHAAARKRPYYWRKELRERAGL